MDVPQHHSQEEEEEEHIPTPVAAQARMQMSTLHPLSEGRGLGSPQNRLPAPLQTVRLPAGKGRAQPCRKPRKLPFPREAAGQYDSKIYFTVAKERHMSRESQQGSAVGSWLQVPGTVRPEPPALPKTLPHLLPPWGPWPMPQH